MVRKIMTEDEGKTKGQVEHSASIKRLISPPQESHKSKKSRTASSLLQTDGSLNETRPVKTLDFSSDQSEGHSRGNRPAISNNKNKMTTVKSICKRGKVEVKEKNDMDSDFTVITEQKASEVKASESPDSHPVVDSHTVTAHMHKPTYKTSMHAVQRSTKEEEIDLNKNQKEATRTSVTSSNGSRDNGTSTSQEQAGGIQTLTGFHQVFVFCVIAILTKSPCC